jgi:AcrR family transcriptional regulator
MAVVAWTALWAWESSPYGLCLHHDGVVGGSFAVGALAFTAGWILMIVAMMLPSSVPLVMTFATLVGRRQRPARLVGLLLLGYLLVWAGFGLAAWAADRGVHAVVEALPWLGAHPELIFAATLLAAGLWQFSPLRDRCLDECRSPLGFVMSRWHGVSERREALLMGIAHGAFCVGCCWSLMLVMVGVGISKPVRDARARRPHGGREEPAERSSPHPTAGGRARPRCRVRGGWVSRESYAPGTSERTAPVGSTRAERRDQATADTHGAIRAAARGRLLADGYANLSTRAVAEAAEVPLSQIHYHFGSKQKLILAVLAAENERLLVRQRAAFDAPEPLWVRWERACDFLDRDLESGYVRILQEMIAAGWTDAEIAAAVRDMIGGWYRVLADAARREGERGANLGGFTPDEVAALMGTPFLGAEELILLGVSETTLPIRSALRKVGALLRSVAEPATDSSASDGRDP